MASFHVIVWFEHEDGTRSITDVYEYDRNRRSHITPRIVKKWVRRFHDGAIEVRRGKLAMVAK